VARSLSGWGAESENRLWRGQFLPDLQAHTHSPAMGQKKGENEEKYRCG